MEKIRRHYPELRDKSWLIYQYETLKKGIHPIAKELGCRPSTVIYAMRCHGIQARHDNGGAPLGSNSGEKSGRWKGGRYVTKEGYVYVKVGRDHPSANRDGYMLEHRLVMERKLGRQLLPNEHVHHTHENKGENDPENLYVLSPSFHAICRKCPLKQEVEHLKSRLREISNTYHLALRI